MTLEMQLFILFESQLGFILSDLIDNNKQVLGQLMAWQQTCDKPWLKSMTP